MSATPDPNTGRTLAGRFAVLGLLGKGGIGAVYRARDAVTGRDVAIKVLLGHRLDARFRARFRREGEVTAALQHPGIVRVFSAGELDDGAPYLAYELIEDGRTLGEALRDPSLGLAKRVGWVRDAARALGFAHARGVVHRDVKPDNLLVDGTDRLRVADFGLAWGEGLERLTRSGIILGTPFYMAPEQFEADGAEARPTADVWALGVTLYQAITGEAPFRFESLEELRLKVLTADPPAPSTINDAVSPSLDAVCLRCLEKMPEARYQDGEALALDLDRALAGQPVLARRTRLSRTARRNALLASGPLAAVALVAAAYALVPGPQAVVPPPATPTKPVAVTPPPTEPPPAPVVTPPATESRPRDSGFGLGPAPPVPAGVSMTGQAAWTVAHNGVPQAMKALGGFYREGKEGFPRDPTEAARWYERGADGGDPECMCEFGVALARGRGVPRDIARAVSLFEQAAAKGNTFAMRQLGDLYHNGDAAPVDEAKALHWYLRHFETDDDTNYTVLRAAKLLLKGSSSVPRDEPRAVALLEAAVERGLPAAARELALLLAEGRGAPKDEARAVALLERALAGGDATSGLHLGEMYAEGRGAPKDAARARALLEDAKQRDVRGADKALRRLGL